KDALHIALTQAGHADAEPTQQTNFFLQHKDLYSLAITVNVTLRFIAAVTLPLGADKGSSGPALRTVSSSGAMPRALSIERTTSARAALRDKFAVSLATAFA